VPIVYASSTQALLDNPYGVSKKEAEDVLLRYGGDSGAPVFLYRLPNVFGKWARPNYNSVIATFCDQVTRGQPVSVHESGAPLSLVYIDDVVESFIRSLGRGGPGGYEEVQPVYRSSVGEVASLLQGFARSRTSLTTAEVGTGFLRALYATYVSYLRPESFAYSSSVYEDARGEFVEMLKTPDCGQFSYFTARSGVTRGEHYHHSKTEKFLVIRGLAKFVFRNVDTGEGHATIVRGGEGRIVETVPGWAHNITNVGDEELIVMLWANEIFDRSRPDTVAMKVAQ
jgi:UDP-2-acetamido-2,6-beta-L-arabino-hexul-4-ose reductase